MELEVARLAERLELLFSVAVAESEVERLLFRLADFDDALDLLSEALSELLALSEADLSDDLLAEASRDALADLESLADRLLFDEESWLADRLALELEVSAELPEVVSVPFEAEPPFDADMLLAVVPLEDEFSLPLVAELL